MARHARRFLVLCSACVLVLLACSPRLDEGQVRTRLVEQMQLRGDDLRVRTIGRESLPVATIDYGGIEAQVRFRRQDGVWVIDAVGGSGRWEPADRNLSVLGQRLTEQAKVHWAQDVMPRYAKTMRLFVGWTELLGRVCDTGLPVGENVLMDLHAVWHRTLFPGRGTEFHNSDLFQRDGWRRPLRESFSASRVDVQSGGADGRMDTADDLRVSYERIERRPGIVACSPHYTVPAYVEAALGNADAPTEWNCSDMLAAFKKAQMLDVAPAPSPR